MNQVLQIIKIFDQSSVRLALIATGAFIFSFIAFTRLRAEYQEQEIVKASLLSLVISFLACWLLSFCSFFDELPVVASISLVVFIFSKKFNWRFWDTVETLISPGLICLAIASFISLRSITYFVIFLTNFFWRSYRNFSWYPSGKVGFVFLIDLVFFSVMSLAFGFWFGRIIEIITWFLVLIAGIIGLIVLSEEKKV